MWELIKEVLKAESSIYMKHKAKGATVIKPSSLLLIIIGILYLLSPIDIIPELWIKPKVFGYIDDLVLLAVIAIYSYGDIGGVFLDARVQTTRVSKPARNVEESIVPSEEQPDVGTSNIPAPVGSSSGTNSLESYMGNNTVRVVDDNSSNTNSNKAVKPSDTEDFYSQFINQRLDTKRRDTDENND